MRDCTLLPTAHPKLSLEIDKNLSCLCMLQQQHTTCTTTRAFVRCECYSLILFVYLARFAIIEVRVIDADLREVSSQAMYQRTEIA